MALFLKSCKIHIDSHTDFWYNATKWGIAMYLKEAFLLALALLGASFTIILGSIAIGIFP